MPAICIIEDFEVHKNEEFIKIAEELKPQLYEEIIKPKSLITLDTDRRNETIINSREDISAMPEKVLKRDDTIIIDFGNHYVGHLTLDLGYTGSHPDAPAYIYIRLAERLDELTANIRDYNGWLSKSWIQEEHLHIDVLPTKLELPRRYAFRYLEIRVVDVTLKYSLKINDLFIRAESAVRMSDVSGIEDRTKDKMLCKIDEVSRRTLHDCMQLVFEDGPKRDRRMWLGDMRLQARANYQTFNDTDLVKRCLYLFGGLTFNEGKVPACIFLEPEIEPDDTYLFDYALLYGSVLLDYYDATGDEKTLKDLYPIAMKQIEIGISYLTEDNIIPDHSGEFWCFVDWGEGLNTQAASLAILIYSLRYGIRLAKHMNDMEMVQYLENMSETLKASAIEHYWDEEEELFVSGEERQISWATQIWMILARVFPKEKNQALILHTIEVNPRIRMVSPYMYHHYIDALIRSDEPEHALDEMKRYWGEMIRDGADTFWELYNPYNKYESPYGLVALNSFCHAWSCTPTYFLRKFFLK